MLHDSSVTSLRISILIHIKIAYTIQEINAGTYQRQVILLVNNKIAVDVELRWERNRTVISDNLT